MFILKQPRTLVLPIVLPLLAMLSLSACGSDNDDDATGSTDCTAFCAKNMCPQDDNAACIMDCQAGAQACPSESAALTRCQLAAPPAAWSCDPDGLTAFDANLCQQEGAAFFACALSAAAQ
jgi:hypothetical protein